MKVAHLEVTDLYFSMQCSVSLSVICPKQLPKIRAIYNAVMMIIVVFCFELAKNLYLGQSAPQLNFSLFTNYDLKFSAIFYLSAYPWFVPKHLVYVC
jgi:hypothetical protein